VTRVEEMRNACRILVEKPEIKDHLKDVFVDDRIILKRILDKLGLDGWDCINRAQDMDKW
jgi:hypothetical protein